MQSVLNYKEWRKFENVINKAKESCKNSDITVIEHFVDIDKTIKMPKGATKNIREVIEKNGGTMPENLPTPKKSLKQLEKENNRLLKNKINKRRFFDKKSVGFANSYKICYNCVNRVFLLYNNINIKEELT